MRRSTIQSRGTAALVFALLGWLSPSAADPPHELELQAIARNANAGHVDRTDTNTWMRYRLFPDGKNLALEVGLEHETIGHTEAAAIRVPIKLGESLLVPRLHIAQTEEELDLEGKLQFTPGTWRMTGVLGKTQSHAYGAVHVQWDYTTNPDEFNASVGGIIKLEDSEAPDFRALGLLRYKRLQLGGVVHNDGRFRYIAGILGTEPHGLRFLGIVNPKEEQHFHQIIYSSNPQFLGLYDPFLFDSISDPDNSELSPNPFQFVKDKTLDKRGLRGEELEYIALVQYAGVGSEGVLRTEALLQLPTGALPCDFGDVLTEAFVGGALNIETKPGRVRDVNGIVGGVFGVLRVRSEFGYNRTTHDIHGELRLALVYRF